MTVEAQHRLLFENHLAFMQAHRGRLIREQTALSFEGSAPFLSFWTPLCDAAELPDGARQVRLLPWSGASWGTKLAKLGFEETQVLSYMILQEAPQSPVAETPPVDILRVSSTRAAEDFAAVQSAGFLSGTDDTDDWWRQCFSRMALSNFGKADQDFYIALDQGEPAAVTLLVRGANNAGVYAVATKPESRGRGLAFGLLQRAWSDVLATGYRSLTLQVAEGSYAQAMYRRYGFFDVFRSELFRCT